MEHMYVYIDVEYAFVWRECERDSTLKQCLKVQYSNTQTELFITTVQCSVVYLTVCAVLFYTGHAEALATLASPKRRSHMLGIATCWALL